MGIDELRGAVRGTVFLPSDEGFDQAARPWNVAVTQSVAAVAPTGGWRASVPAHGGDECNPRPPRTACPGWRAATPSSV